MQEKKDFKRFLQILKIKVNNSPFKEVNNSQFNNNFNILFQTYK